MKNLKQLNVLLTRAAITGVLAATVAVFGFAVMADHFANPESTVVKIDPNVETGKLIDEHLQKENSTLGQKPGGTPLEGKDEGNPLDKDDTLGFDIL